MTSTVPARGKTVSPTGRRYAQLVLVLGALIALGPLTIDMYLPAFPRIGDELGASDSAVQLTLTGMLLGLAVGQLVIGPLSDAFGRRRPLVIGLCAHSAASLLCAIAPTVVVLAAVRVVQGLAGAALSVVAMAIVRDLFAGVGVARIMSRLMLVIGLAPILAPSIGSLVLGFTSWRGIFVVLAGAALLVVGLTGCGGLAGVLVPLALVVSLAGLAIPNTPALALTRHGEAAGTAAAVLGCVQFGVGAVVAPLVGAFGSTTAAPMGGVMLGVTLLAAVLLFGVVRRERSPAFR